MATKRERFSSLMKRLSVARVLVVLVAVGLVVLGAVFKVDVGTLCNYCPVGLAQISAASREIQPLLFYSAIVVVAFSVFLGRFLCAWLCPTNLLPFKKRGIRTGVFKTDGKVSPSRAEWSTKKSILDITTPGRAAILLVGIIAISFIVGFPVFCLFCPIGLFFGFVFALFKTFTIYQASWDLVIFPAMLFLEFALFKRWCSLICPIGALMSLVGKLSPIRLRPVADEDACQIDNGCRVCESRCPSGIPAANIGRADDEDCSLCMNCIGRCPHQALPTITTGSKRDRDKVAH